MKRNEAPTRIFDLLDDCDLVLKYVRYVDGDAAMSRRDIRRAGWRRKSDLLSHALMHRGLRRGDTVGIVGDVSPEYAFVDFGIMQTGALPLHLDDSLTAEQYIEVLRDARMLFVMDDALLARMRLIVPQMGRVGLVVAAGDDGCGLSVDGLIAEGRKHVDDSQLQRRRSLISADEACIIQYRGGTSSTRLSHKALLRNVLE